MRRVTPWNIDGIKPDIREAAREAARRHGLTLAEWLNDVIVTQAAKDGIDAEDMDADDRLEAVAARLNQLGGRQRADRSTERPTRERPTRNGAQRSMRDDRVTRGDRAIHDDEDEDDFNPRFGKRSAFESDILDTRHPPRRAEKPAEKPRDLLRMQDAEALLDAAVEAFDERAARHQQETAKSVEAVTRLIKSHTRQRDNSLEVLSDISNRLSDIETQMTRQAIDEASGHVDRDRDLEILPDVARRLADIETHLSRRAQDDSYKPVRTALTRLEARLDALSKKPQIPARDDSGLKRLEGKLDALLQTSTLARAEAPIARAPAKTNWRESLDSAVSEIVQQQRLLNGEASERRVAPRRREDAFLNGHADRPAEPPMPDFHPLQGDIAALNSKLEAIRMQDLAVDLNRLQAEIGSMSAGLADLAPRTAVTALESAISNLTARLESSREDGMRESLLKPLTELAADVRDSLNATTQDIHTMLASTHPLSVEQIERKVEALSAQIERQQSYIPTQLGPSEDDFALSRQNQAHAESLIKIEDRLEHLSDKVERAFAARPAQSARMDPESLEAIVRALSDKFAAARDPRATVETFEALQGQIAELAMRLERSDAGFSALASLQGSVRELFTHLDETRYAAAEAAQTSARNAAREAVREVLEQPGLLADRVVKDSGITREIADLRSLQNQADERTHSTLNAVHQTLEKIVDRLAMLEEDIGEAQETSAAGLRLAEQASYNARQPNLGPLADTDLPTHSKAQAPDQKGRNAQVDAILNVRPSSANTADFLIEPGALFSARQDIPASKAKKPAPAETAPDQPGRSRADFIAAARRAAQAAQADQDQHETAAARPRIPMADAKAEGVQAGLIAQTRDFLTTHKRQLTLSIAALFLVVGAYAVVKTMGGAHTTADVSSSADKAIHGMADTRIERKAETRASAVDAAMPPQVPADKSASPPANSNAAPAAVPPSASAEPVKSDLPMMAAIANKKPITGSDPIVTSSISQPKNANAETPAAAQALRQQAEAGNAIAQYELASRYAEGRLMTRDFKLAADWYEKAAAHGLASAEYRLGSLYEKGLGVTRDFTRAKTLYQKAAEQGHSHAMHNLAVLVAEGGDGKPDYATASTWFRKAADLGIRDSQYNLAILYARGLGVQQDLVQSYMWFSAAAAQGDEDAGKKQEDVAAKLNAKSLAQAKALAAAFRAREPDPAVNEVPMPAGGWEATVPTQIIPKVSSRPKISRL